MNYTKRIISLLLVLVMALGLLSACGEAGEEKPLRVSLPSGVSSLDPAFIRTETERIVVSHLYENLMKVSGVDENGVVTTANGLIRGYNCEDNLDGSQTYTFNLRDDCVWSDGKTVTAGDFVYAWRRLADPDNHSPNAAMLNMVAGYSKVRSTGDSRKLRVKELDEQTLEVVLSHRCPYFISEVCTSPVTMPVRREAIQHKGWSMNTEYQLFNGPYSQVEGWSEDGFIARADEDYYNHRRLGPKALEFLFYEDDTADFRMELSDDVIAQRPESWSADPYPRTVGVVINQNARSYQSRELRQAMAMVIDRQAITDLLDGSVCYRPAEGLIPYGMRATNGEMFRTVAGPALEMTKEAYEMRCEKARELIEGKELPESVYLSYPAVTTIETVVTEVQKVWQEQLGLHVKLRPMGIKEMSTALIKGDFSVALTALETDRGDASGMLDNWRSGARKNFANIHYSAYDLLMRVSDKSASAEARDAYFADAEQMLLESGYVMPIYHGTQTAMLADGLTGLVYDGLGVYYFSGVVKVK